MKRFYTLLFLALIGLLIGIADIMYGNQPSKIQAKPILTMKPPFKAYIAGTGMIEAESTNIPIGSTVSGVVAKVYVKVGQNVKAGDVLFSIDDRDIQAKFITAKAKVEAVQTTLAKAKHQFRIAKDLKAVSPQMISKKAYQDHMDDVTHAKAMVSLAQAEVLRLKKESERYTVHALINGRILQCKMREGKFAGGKDPLIILGSKPMNLRVDINEYDLWRMRPNAKAVAFVRGHPKLMISLDYDHTEPYIIPKTALTGLSTERTDIRVLQVIYRLKKPDFPLYVGQQLDVFIDAGDSNKTRGI